MANKAKAIEKALKFIQKGQYDKAIQEYLGILKDDPNDVRILTKIGDLYQKSGKKDEAIKYYVKAADEYRKKGFETKAAAAYKQALELDPKRIDLHYKLAEFYANAGLIKDALRHYKNVVKLYELEGRLDKAVDILEKMVKLDPEDYTIKAKYVEALLAAGKTNQAEVRIPSVIEGFKLHHKLVDLAGFYEKLLNYKPGDVDILTDLSDIYIQIGNPRKAINKLKQIYEAGKFTERHFLLLAKAYEMLGKKEKALHILKEALNEFKNDREKGKIIAEKILAFDPEDETARRFLGIKDEKKDELEVIVGEEDMLDDEEEAIVAEVETSGGEHFFTTNFDQSQPQVSGLMRRADVFLQNGLTDKAIQTLEEAIKMDPHNIDARAKLIDVYKRVNPKGAVPHLIALAEISDSLGDIVSAREYAEEALRIDPSNKLAQEKVEQYSWGGEEEEESLDMVVPADDSEILGTTDIGLDEEVLKSAPSSGDKIPSSILEELSDAEFFAEQGLVDEAISIYEKILSEHPELDEVRRKYEKLKQQSETKENVNTEIETVTEVGANKNSITQGSDVDGVESEEVIDDAELIEEIGDLEESEEKVDLRELIGEKLPEEEGEAGFDVPSLEDTIKAFKEGVKKELEDSDSSAHYDLGIAYKEMGLYEDAIEEFKIAAKDPERFVESATMIGLCYRDKGELNEAAKWFLKALKAPNLNEDAYLELNYELGKIFETKGDLKKAIFFYKNVLEKNKRYRDIVERIKAIKEKILKSRS